MKPLALAEKKQRAIKQKGNEESQSKTEEMKQGSSSSQQNWYPKLQQSLMPTGDDWQVIANYDECSDYSPVSNSAARCAIIMVGAAVFPEVIVGIAEASTTRR